MRYSCSYDRAVIVVTHDRDFAAADHVVIMSDGRIVQGL
jgi:ABC-type sulfate/molybdate transport systems ATPase subunit